MQTSYLSSVSQDKLWFLNICILGRKLLSFSTWKWERGGGCTEHHGNSVWDQPRARRRRREQRGEGTGPSFGCETANRSGSSRLFLPPSMRSHFNFCASMRASTAHRQPAHRASHSLGSFWGYQNPNLDLTPGTWSNTLLRERDSVKPLTLPITSHVRLTVLVAVMDTDHSPVKTGTSFCISELKRMTTKPGAVVEQPGAPIFASTEGGSWTSPFQQHTATKWFLPH